MSWINAAQLLYNGITGEIGKSCTKSESVVEHKKPKVEKTHNNAEFLLDNSGCEYDIDRYLGSGGFFRGAGETANVHKGAQTTGCESQWESGCMWKLVVVNGGAVTHISGRSYS